MFLWYWERKGKRKINSFHLFFLLPRAQHLIRLCDYHLARPTLKAKNYIKQGSQTAAGVLNSDIFQVCLLVLWLKVEATGDYLNIIKLSTNWPTDHPTLILVNCCRFSIIMLQKIISRFFIPMWINSPVYKWANFNNKLQSVVFFNILLMKYIILIEFNIKHIAVFSSSLPLNPIKNLKY